MEYIKGTAIDILINYYQSEISLLVIVMFIFLIAKIGFLRILFWLLKKIL
ncbi:hypothetical protein NHP164001_19270 [Helicobacter trogontum]|uniref:Uncharacterized protein n=1 Tax=Helicobacter trogontum TaxID=50960 RepID=A0ABQ0D6P7_9HELI